MTLHPLYWTKSAARLAALLAGMALQPATAQDFAPTGTGANIQTYGQINMGYMSYNDSVATYSYPLVDNSNNDDGTYFGLTAEYPLESGGMLGARFELGLSPPRSDTVNQNLSYSDSWKFDKTNLRRAELSFASDRLGAIYLGQGSMSSDTGGPDFSGTGVIASRNVADVGGGHFRRFPDETLSTRTVGAQIEDFNGTRKFRVRYDTPVFSGYSFSASFGREILVSGDNSNYLDISGNYKRDGKNFTVEVEMSLTGIGDGEYAFVGSAAALHKPTGLNITYSGSKTTLGPHYQYFKFGVIGDYFSVGSTAISLDLYNSGAFIVPDSEAVTTGYSIVQEIDAANLELYASYRDMGAYNNTRNPTENWLSGKAVMAGINWQF